MYQAVRAWDEWAAPGGEDEPATVTAQRAGLRRRQTEIVALDKAADTLERCGRDLIAWRCTANPAHVHITRRWCGLATLCPDCARMESGRLAAVYGERVRAVLRRGVKGVRARLVTLALRPRATETLEDAFERCREHGRRVLRVLYGVPVGRKDWQLYRELFPLSARELEAAGDKPRQAWAARRRQVEAATIRKAAGWLVASEFGERGMKAHVHALVLGRYVSHRLLSRAWHLATGDSFVADVRPARNVLEVVKYPVKHIARSPAELAALYRVMAARRRIEAYGSLRARSAGEQDAKPGMTCPECGEAMEGWGVIPEVMARAGVRAPPSAYQFRPFGRAGP